MSSFFNSPNRFGSVLFAALALALLAHHAWGYVGHFGFDDIHYARLSQQFAKGIFHTSEDHYTFRWGLIWLNGLAYKVFGMNDHSSALTPMAATLFTVWLVWQMSARLPLGARAFAMVFTALSEWVFFYSDKIMPDILVMCGVTAALASVYWHRFGNWQDRPIRAALALAASLTFCFLCKETVLLVLPLLGWLMVADLWQQQRQRFWAWAALFGVISALFYFTAIYAITGDVLGRVRAIAANSYFNPCSYDQLPVEHLLRRIGRDLWAVFFGAGVGVGWVLLLPTLLLRRHWKNLLCGSSADDFLLLCGASLLLLSNFMTTAPTAYVPLCPDIRHYLFAVPFTGLAAAVGATDFLEKRASVRHGAVVGLALTAAWVAWQFQPEQFKLYGSLAGAIGVVFLWRFWRVSTPTPTPPPVGAAEDIVADPSPPFSSRAGWWPQFLHSQFSILNSSPPTSSRAGWWPPFSILNSQFSILNSSSGWWLLLLAPLLWKPAQVMRAAQDSNYPHQKRLVLQHFSPGAAPDGLVVISNNAEKNIDEYLLGFDTTGVRFLSFKQVNAACMAAADSIELIINGTTAYLSGMDWEAMPFWVKQPDASRRLIDTTRHIELFGQNKQDLVRRLEAGQ